MKLAGKNIIITGANQGLGLEIAKQFVIEGANVMLCARNAETLMQVQNDLQKLAGTTSKVLAKPTDVSQINQVETLIATTLNARKDTMGQSQMPAFMDQRTH